MPYGIPMLQYAIESNKVEAVRYLIEMGCDTEIKFKLINFEEGTSRLWTPRDYVTMLQEKREEVEKMLNR